MREKERNESGIFKLEFCMLNYVVCCCEVLCKCFENMIFMLLGLID